MQPRSGDKKCVAQLTLSLAREVVCVFFFSFFATLHILNSARAAMSVLRLAKRNTLTSLSSVLVLVRKPWRRCIIVARSPKQQQRWQRRSRRARLRSATLCGKHGNLLKKTHVTEFAHKRSLYILRKGGVTLTRFPNTTGGRDVISGRALEFGARQQIITGWWNKTVFLSSFITSFFFDSIQYLIIKKMI